MEAPETSGNGNALMVMKYNMKIDMGMDTSVIYQPASGPHLVTDFTGPPSKMEVTEVEKSRQGPSEQLGWSILKAALIPKKAKKAMMADTTTNRLAAMSAIRVEDIPRRYNSLFRT